MPLIATRGAASVQGFGEFAQAAAPVYIEDVFSTWLYTGNGSTQTITNNIDLSTKGGLVWIKDRTTAYDHQLYDTARGANKTIRSNLTNAEQTYTTALTSFNTNGFSLGSQVTSNNSGDNIVSWTFRKQPKFFDIVTYTGNGSTQNIAHALGSVPGMMIVKAVSTTGNWPVYHRSLGATQKVWVNVTNAASAAAQWNNTEPTSTQFTVGTDSDVNSNGVSYVAYLFAHNAGGFGLTGSDNVITCGSVFTTSGGSPWNVNLGWEPQFVIIKKSSGTGDWLLLDIMREWSQTNAQMLYPNLSVQEFASSPSVIGVPTATGFTITGSGFDSNSTYIYIAIRRGPMKTPTTGTSVFIPVTYAGNGSTTAGQLVTSNFPVDMGINRYNRAGSGDWDLVDRLRGLTSIGVSPNSRYLNPPSTAAEGLGGYIFDATNTSVDNYGFSASFTQLNYLFQRAPGFFDVVCYTGDGTLNRQVNHNLTVTPELIIAKRRSGAQSWIVFGSVISTNNYLILDSTGALNSLGATTVYASTSTTFGAQAFLNYNDSAVTYVAYLFASVSGVSKVGSYTGTGALQTVNCGFTGGARFVIIKRTDSTGDWWVYDSARGISSGNDPYLFLNSNVAEVTNTNYVDTTSVGFQVTAAAPAGLNANGGSYIFWAVA